jgi:copper homeostasis protein
MVGREIHMHAGDREERPIAAAEPKQHRERNRQMRDTISVEICINCDGPQDIEDSVGAAHAGGASTVELCSAMHFDGLTPSVNQISAARLAFDNRPGLLVMIRPRQGNFLYSPKEIVAIHRQIEAAATAGADGVVFGALNEARCLALDVCRELIKTALASDLRPSFHRAFDSTPDPVVTLDQLIDLGVDRVLTSGIPWGHDGTAWDGIDRLGQLVGHAQGKIEIVIGGGVNTSNVARILRKLPPHADRISVHAFTGVQRNGRTTESAVRSLVAAVGRARYGSPPV